MTTERKADRLTTANVLLDEITAQLTQQPAPKTALEQLRRGALDGLQTELGSLCQLLSVKKYRLVFIGQVAVGKTTAICHLVGLTAERQKKKKTSKAGPERPILVVEDLMATGSGFTTLCEVVVMPADESRFEIEPYEREEVERTISDFCVSIWRRAHPAKDEQDSGPPEQVNFPTELVRAVRNIVRLSDGDRREDDAAYRLASEFSADQFEQFRFSVLERANLDARQQTVFDCGSNETDPRAWIKNTFDDLNLARIPTVAIPRRITLHVRRDLLAPETEGFEALIDTKGVDAAQFNRADIDSYIRHDPAAICVLAERFESAPTNVISLLLRHVTKEAPLSVTKFLLMVVPRASEPEKVVGGRGQVGDRDDGLDLRRNQIEDTLSSRGLPRFDDRLVFFDPLRHHDAVGVDFRLRGDSAPSDVQENRKEMWQYIKQAIDTREKRVWDRVSEIRESFRKIREGRGLDTAEEQLVIEAKSRISEYRQITFANADRFVEMHRGQWTIANGRYSGTLRATNNRFGEYPHRNVDIYYDAIPIAEELVRAAATKPKDEILQIVGEIQQRAGEDSDLHELLAVLEGRIDALFEAVVQEVGGIMQGHLKDSSFAPQDASNSFWMSVQGRFGKGKGFQEDVLAMYGAQMSDCETFLSQVASDSWKRTLIDPILVYLG